MPTRIALALPLVLLAAGCGATIERPGGGPGPGPGAGRADGGGGGNGCIDQDGDGRGAACPLGPDCDDRNPNLWMNCPQTGEQTVTLGGGQPFDPKDPGSSGVKGDGMGGLVLDPGNFASTTAPIIWVANSAEGTVSKVDTRTTKELARYRTGPGNPDPSRTTVGLGGDVVVANRFGNGATKIASELGRCVDKNGNGKIDTSTGPGDVLPWGSDECVLWNVSFPPNSVARAAAYDAQTGVDGGDSSTVWIGLYSRQEMRQLDSVTGKELAVVSVAPIRPYGAAVDKYGNVWVRGGGLAKIDPKHNVSQYQETCGYGIAVDPMGRVWTAGSGCVARFDPIQNKWQSQPVGNGGFNRGLAVDAKGSVWVADTNFGVHQLDMNTMQVKKDLAIGASNFVGMAIDFDGGVWTIAQGSSRAIKIDPVTYKTSSVAVGQGPYTYSDMTGFQLRNAAAPFGKWRHTFQGCSKETKFDSLAWMAALPPGTALTFKARSGADLAALQAAPWVQLASSPPDAPPINLAAKMGPAATGALFEIEVTLKSLTPDTTPTLQALSLSMSCVPGIG